MFTQKCFIRKNTPELVKKLELLGYIIVNFGVIDIFNGKPYLLTDTNGGIYGMFNPEEGCIYCGANEELFLAIAALRDDSDYMQWFTNGEKWYQDILCDREVEKYGASKPISFHKATVQELIKHFKK